MLRPQYRLPALLTAVLAIPGNVDNLMPQMRLDANDIANNTAPAISVVDLLLAWALVLTLREGRARLGAGIERLALALTLLALALAAVSAIVAAVNGIEIWAVVRGVLVFARIGAVVLLAVSLRDSLGDGRLILVAATLAAVALLGNGIYTSSINADDRFTASTLGRNGFSLALVLACIGAGGAALAFAVEHRGRRWLVVGAAALAAASIFGAVATGTRMSLLAFIPALAVGLGLSRFWKTRGSTRAVAVAVVVLVVSIAAAGLITAEGGRAVGAVTNLDDTVDIITDPEGEPSYSSVRSRTRFWQQAVAMAVAKPAFGVGPYQWNIVRYHIDAQAPETVADPHNTYLQIAAEFGSPLLLAYLGLLGTVAIGILGAAWRSREPIPLATTALLIGSMVYPITELTNSHLFNVRLGVVGWIFIACALVVLRARPWAATSSVRSRESAPPLPAR